LLLPLLLLSLSFHPSDPTRERGRRPGMSSAPSARGQ
jgi:hypothetical protein